MADPKDVENTKIVRREFIRRKVNVNQADVRVSHGVVYIRGVIRAEKNAEYTDVKAETEKIARIVRQKSSIREVVIDVIYRY
jgi:hypothetical protein